MKLNRVMSSILIVLCVQLGTVVAASGQKECEGIGVLQNEGCLDFVEISFGFSTEKIIESKDALVHERSDHFKEIFETELRKRITPDGIPGPRVLVDDDSVASFTMPVSITSIGPDGHRHYDVDDMAQRIESHLCAYAEEGVVAVRVVQDKAKTICYYTKDGWVSIHGFAVDYKVGKHGRWDRWKMDSVVDTYIASPDRIMSVPLGALEQLKHDSNPIQITASWRSFYRPELYAARRGAGVDTPSQLQYLRSDTAEVVRDCTLKKGDRPYGMASSVSDSLAYVSFSADGETQIKELPSLKDVGRKIMSRVEALAMNERNLYAASISRDEKETVLKRRSGDDWVDLEGALPFVVSGLVSVQPGRLLASTRGTVRVGSSLYYLDLESDRVTATLLKRALTWIHPLDKTERPARLESLARHGDDFLGAWRRLFRLDLRDLVAVPIGREFKLKNEKDGVYGLAQEVRGAKD